jgi:hypothetical protein
MHSTAARAQAIVLVEVTGDRLKVSLADDRRVSVPLSWYPRLAEGTPGEQAVWELIGRGSGVHWPLLDEDISLDQLLDGQRSGEGEASLARWRTWLADRRRADVTGAPSPRYPAEIASNSCP